MKEVLVGKSPQTTSPAGKVDTVDMAKVVRTGMLMGLSTTISLILSGAYPGFFGKQEMLTTFIFTIMSEIALRWIKSNGK